MLLRVRRRAPRPLRAAPALVPSRRFATSGRFLDAVQASPTVRDDLAGKPEVLRRMRAVWSALTEADWRKVSAAYWAVVTYLDHEVGRLVVGWVDGWMGGSHPVIHSSSHPFLHIPLVVRAPGVAVPREEAAALVSLLDLGPALLDLCGLAPLPDAQGRSLRGVLDGTADPAHWQDAYAEFFGQRFVYTQRIVWHGPWKYVFSPVPSRRFATSGRFFPHERRNLAAAPAHGDTLEAMVRRMWRTMARIGDTSLHNTHYATLRTAPIGPMSGSNGPPDGVDPAGARRMPGGRPESA